MKEGDDDVSEEMARDYDAWHDEDNIAQVDGANAQLLTRSASHHSAHRSISNASKAKIKLEVEGNPKHGIMWFIGYCFLKAVSYLVVVMLYRRKWLMTPFQLFFMRSLMGFGVLVVHLNINIKKHVWDGIVWR